jgi:hypothetical protein
MSPRAVEWLKFSRLQGRSEFDSMEDRGNRDSDEEGKASSRTPLKTQFGHFNIYKYIHCPILIIAILHHNEDHLVTLNKKKTIIIKST